MSSSSINSRFKVLGFGSKRKSGASTTSSHQDDIVSASTSQLQISQSGGPITSAASSSTSLPINHSTSSVRPPSYTNNFSPAPARAGHQSPMLNNPRNTPSQTINGPPPINTASAAYSSTNLSGTMVGPQSSTSGPPGYGPPQYASIPGSQAVSNIQYSNRNNAVEVEGAGRSKAQLIVGIDFVRPLLSFMRKY